MQSQEPELPNLKLSQSLKHQINNTSDPYDGSQSEDDTYEEGLLLSQTPMVTNMQEPFTASHSHTPATPEDMSTSTTTPLLKKRNNFQF